MFAIEDVAEVVTNIATEGVPAATEPWWMNVIMAVVFIGMAFFWVFAMEATLDANKSMRKR